MRSQPSPARLAPTPSGVLVVDGYGVRIRVDHGRLVVADGIGPARRLGQFDRATSRLRRLVLLGHTGSITIDALRWLSDVGVALLAIDTDGRLLAASGGLGRDDPRLRRAQAIAIDTPTGNDIARRLIAEKIAAQADTLGSVIAMVPVANEVVAAMRDATSRLHVATSRDEIRLAEAQAAAAYWSVWSPLGLRFATRDAARVPQHWRTFGTRASPLTGTSRVAANPAHAISNYLYAILESEARLACLAVGLDPGLGVLHADLRARDSLALDVMEPVRPRVDAYVLDLLARHAFRAVDFYETRQGACRIVEPLTHQLAETDSAWARALGPIAERVARLLVGGDASDPTRSPTPLTGSNRSRRQLSKAAGAQAMMRAPRPPTACLSCGAIAPGRKRRYCAGCSPTAVAAIRQDAFKAAKARLSELRTAGGRPGIGGKAAATRGMKIVASRKAIRTWEAVHGTGQDSARFTSEVLPLLKGLRPSELAASTGLARHYCAAILKGSRVPHPRWWGRLGLLGVEGSGSMGTTRNVASGEGKAP